MALEWHFERIQWQLFRRKSLEFPCIFPCYREFGRERFARDWILRQQKTQPRLGGFLAGAGSFFERPLNKPVLPYSCFDQALRCLHRQDPRDFKSCSREKFVPFALRALEPAGYQQDFEVEPFAEVESIVPISPQLRKPGRQQESLSARRPMQARGRTWSPPVS